MVCYLVRHGKDDNTIRGGWSNHGLTPQGREQVEELAKSLAASGVKLDAIYSSDLERAKETAEILAKFLPASITYKKEFRETNNGVLAGMKNEQAEKDYPGLYWASLGYAERYPKGESPKMFFHRIRRAWYSLKKEALAKQEENIMLVSHAGVMEVILCIENGIRFTNKEKHFFIPNAKLVEVNIE